MKITKLPYGIQPAHNEIVLEMRGDNERMAAEVYVSGYAGDRLHRVKLKSVVIDGLAKFDLRGFVSSLLEEGYRVVNLNTGHLPVKRVMFVDSGLFATYRIESTDGEVSGDFYAINAVKQMGESVDLTTSDDIILTNTISGEYVDLEGVKNYVLPYYKGFPIGTALLYTGQTSYVGTNGLVFSMAVKAGDKIAIPITREAGERGRVVWGDGIAEALDGGRELYIEHTYANSGTYKVMLLPEDDWLPYIDLKKTSPQKCKPFQDALLEVDRFVEGALPCMFTNCVRLQAINDRPSGSTSGNSISYMFYNCSSLGELPRNYFANYPNLAFTHAISVFDGAGFNRLPEDFFRRMYKLHTATAAFANTTNLTLWEAEKPIFQDTILSNVVGMFEGSGIRYFPTDMFVGLHRAKSLERFFKNSTLLAFIGYPNRPALEEFVNVTSMDNFAEGCEDFEGLSSDGLMNCIALQSMIGAFYGCSSYSGSAPLFRVNGVTMPIYKSGIVGNSCFYRCTNILDYDDMPPQWTAGYVVNK